MPTYFSFDSAPHLLRDYVPRPGLLRQPNNSRQVFQKPTYPLATGTATHSGNSQGIRNTMQVPLPSETNEL